MTKPRCERCGNPDAVQLGERIICERCYFEINSCCGHEFEPLEIKCQHTPQASDEYAELD